jgi:large subunit ribosomal protein L5
MAKAVSPKERYEKEIVPKLMKELGIKNTNAIPKLNKITVNAGLGTMYTSGTKDFSEFVENFRLITGQNPVVNKAKKAISNFKLREGLPNGISVTLRGKRMYDFVEKLVHIVFPRVRDFRGISDKSFDGNGNYSIGLREHTVFPEINPDDIVKIHGIQVCINTTAKNNDEGRALLKAFGFPFKRAAAVAKPTKGSSMEGASATEVRDLAAKNEQEEPVRRSAKKSPKEEPKEEPPAEDLPGESVSPTI